MTLLRELEEMIRAYAPMRPLKEIMAEVVHERDLPNDPMFYIEFQNTVANLYMRVCEAKQAEADMQRMEGGGEESGTD